MKIVFLGTPEFAVESLHILVKNNYNVVAVVTAPDKPAGRGQVLQQSAVKKYALEHKLNVLQPTNLKDKHFITELKQQNADLQIVVAFRMLPEAVWNMPRYGTYNLHASLLPKYRGAAPINWAIMNGETESGVTTFKLQHEIDSGNIMFQEKQEFNNTTTAGELHDLLMKKGAGLILKTVMAIEANELKGEPLRFISQEPEKATHAPKLDKQICRIDWKDDVVLIYNKIRGLSPYPAAFAYLDMKGSRMIVKIFKATFKVEHHEQPNGLIYTDSSSFLKVFCKNGWIEVLEIQIEGKKRMPVTEFLKGIKSEYLNLFC